MTTEQAADAIARAKAGKHPLACSFAGRESVTAEPVNPG
jgi:hypothetical protein